MVYGAFALLADVLIIPFLRASMSLEIGSEPVHQKNFRNQLDGQNAISSIFIMGIPGNLIVCLDNLQSAGGIFVTGRTTRVSGDTRLGVLWKDGQRRHGLNSTRHYLGGVLRGTIGELGDEDTRFQGQQAVL